jgi:methionyl-tRNA formyltransferase
LRTVFFGTSEFAVPSLRTLAAHSDVRLVVTQPDRPSGRGHRLHPTPVKLAARELGLAILEPARLIEALEALGEAGADLFALASYGKIVPRAILAVPPLGFLNVHPSLLPLYRGATPLQSALRDGVTRSGVTIMQMDAGMDTGDIVLQEARPVGPRETYGALHDRFAALGADLLARALERALAGTLERIPQASLGVPPAEIAATSTRPLTKGDLAIDWSRPAKAVVDRVRSLAPQPLARHLLQGGGGVKIVSARLAGDAERDLLLAGIGNTNAVRAGTWHVVPETGSMKPIALVVCGEGAVVVERAIAPNRGETDGATVAMMLAGESQAGPVSRR